MTQHYFLACTFCLLILTGSFLACECDDLSPELPDIEETDFVDLTVDSIYGLSVDCDEGEFESGCATSVFVTISNIGNIKTGTFIFQVVIDPEQELVRIDSISSLAPNSSLDIPVSFSTDGFCLEFDCTVTATADIFNDIEESDENNNTLQVIIEG